ncbi:hypothetical protein BFJ72_g14450 [Fusarium proliferatum]|uniref:Uncharacterized protein n=1 Tax=Gibberella intermedia TaxID=948311 RepID=A0A420S2W7_GIBIN|nr:hypothetical protein BFJ72_g14450 [Fusarium proliferatum]
MSSSPQILGQVTSGRSLQPSRAKPPAGSPTVAIEHPYLHYPPRPLFAAEEPGNGSILNGTKAIMRKVDDKMSVSRNALDRDPFGLRYVKADTVGLDWEDVIPADRLGEMEAEEKEKETQAYLGKLLAKGAPRRAAIRRRNRGSERDSRPKKLHKEQQDGERYKNNFLRAWSPEGQDYPPSEAYGSLLSLRRLRSTHYTISQDHTSGQEAHEDSVLASFGKRRRTDDPSISPSEGRLLQRSLSLLASGDNAVAEDEGFGTQQIFEANLHDRQPVVSNMAEDTVSLTQGPVPGFTDFSPAKEETNEGKHKRDDFELVGARKRGRHRQMLDTSLVDRSGDTAPGSASPQDMAQLTSVDRVKISELAQKMYNTASEEQRYRTRSQLSQLLTPTQMFELTAQGRDPLIWFYQRQAFQVVKANARRTQVVKSNHEEK